jgi:hypothetical protein
VTQLLDRLIGDTEHVEVHHRVVTATVDDVDHPGQERLDRIAGHDDRPRANTARLGSVARERPPIAGVIDLVHVSGQGYGDLAWCGRYSLLM